MKFLYKICCLMWAVLPTSNMSAEIFTGKMEAVSFQNIDDKTIQYSSGIGYNGACKESIIVSPTKTVVNNASLLYSTLLDEDSKRVYIWCEKMGEGVEVDYNEYVTIFSVFTDAPRQFMGTTIPAYTYKLKLGADNLTAFGKPANFYSGIIENPYASASIQCETVPSLEVTPSLRCIFQNGLNIQGLVVKFRWTMDNRAAALGQFKSYMGKEVISLDNEYVPSDDDFNPPASVKFTKIQVQGIDSFYKKIGKFLRKNNLFPDQTGNEFIYEVNEDEWSY